MSSKDESQKDVKVAPTPEEVLKQTQHTININGETIEYTATAGTILIREEDEKEGHKPKASIFYIAYQRTNGVEVEKRPITFSFNGGPGSSSVWLHLGLLGPKRVLMDEVGNPLPPPYQLVENEFSLLDKTDLVFIDPVSTGFSRAVPGEKANQFHEFKKDIETVGEFIRLFITRNKRWASPKFLIGESYGTTRAAGLSGFLQNEYGMYLNGLMLISSVLDFQTLIFNPGNDYPPMLFLPTFAATAWYHQQLDDALQAMSLRDLLTEVEAFVESDYASALILGDKLSAEKRQQIISTLARYTGLTEAYVEQTNIRINIHQFVKELLRSEKRTIGRLDSRFKGIDRTAVGAGHSYDPSYITIQGTYTATLNDYLRRDLEFESDLPYEILTGKVWPWDYKVFQNRYTDVAETLRDAMSRNRFLKVYVANGYYDMATPYFATEYTFNHLGLDPSLKENVSMGYFEAGHMMYVHQQSLADLKEDLANFVDSALVS